MSEFETLSGRVGARALERLMKLGLIKRPESLEMTISVESDSRIACPNKNTSTVSVQSNDRQQSTDKDHVLRQLEEIRRTASTELDPDRRSSLGQFMTPAPIANFMASLFQNWPKNVFLLEPGAGIGSLAYAFANRFFDHNADGMLNIAAYEIEPRLAEHLRRHVCQLSSGREKQLHAEVLQRDFIQEAAFASAFRADRYTHVIMNPPYKKIGSQSEYRRLLRLIGVETGNLYSAFLALSIRLTVEGGEIVAIVPRSFCNGMYFRPFRAWLLANVAISQIHIFESRNKAFKDDDVLQENIIVRLIRNGKQGAVVISTSDGESFDVYNERVLPFEEIIRPGDPEQFIHIPTFENSLVGASRSLAELGLDVATGPIVDFRLREHCLATPEPGSAPLLYAHHFLNGDIYWPRNHKKPNAVRVNDATKKWLMPGGWYTVTKRFSAKEERRRIVAYVVDPRKLPHKLVGFENHLNVIHSKKAGISEELARGLAVFLNSTVVDRNFRNFSGHTQVNATDLRSLKFPDEKTLLALGRWALQQPTLDQQTIDTRVEALDGNEATSN